MRKVSENERQQIVADVAAEFRCFGEGSSPRIEGNPIAEAMKDQPAQFAAGVDVRQVVDFILSRL